MIWRWDIKFYPTLYIAGQTQMNNAASKMRMKVFEQTRIPRLPVYVQEK